MTTIAFYARLSRRIKAVLIDGLLISLLVYLAIFVPIYLGIEAVTLASVIGLCLAFSVEPILVSYRGASIGHMIYGLRIQEVNSDRKLGLLKSYLRLFIKLPLGIVSLVTVSATRRHQAIHDLVCQSVVVLSSPESLPSREALAERDFDHDRYTYPPIWRRVLVTMIYVLLVFFVAALATGLALSENCLNADRCTDYDGIIEFSLSALFWLSVFVLVWLGSQGRLPGARRKVGTVSEDIGDE